MNPYIEKRDEIRKKSWEWVKMNKEKPNIYNPYSEELLDIGMKVRTWDMRRKREIKKTNNSSISEISVHNHPSNFYLSPRVKLIYDRVSGPYVQAHSYAGMVRDMFSKWPTMSDKPVYINLDDVQSPLYSPSTTIFFRDFSFIDPATLAGDVQLYDKINKSRDFLLTQKLTYFSFYYGGRHVEFKARVPISENPKEMIAQFAAAHPGYMDHCLPVIQVNNLVSKWFDSPGSIIEAKPLLELFSVFGTVRFFELKQERDVCTAFVAYYFSGAFVKALMTLCCSLRRGVSHELNDYEVTLISMDCLPLSRAPSPQIISKSDAILGRMDELKLDELV